jgi:hypothetical protein
MAAFSAVFEADPLFYESNILPGDNMSRYFTVHNSDQHTRRVYIQAEETTDADQLGGQMEINISRQDGQANLYSGSLADFLQAGWIRLDDLNRGAEAAYGVEIKFLAESENVYQAKSLNFDIALKSEPGKDKPDICKKNCGHKWKWRHWHYWNNKAVSACKKLGNIFRRS